MPNVSNIVKSIQDIMRKDAGTYGDAQRLEQLGWMFFLKILDDREKRRRQKEKSFESALPNKLRWSTWTSITADDELVGFINDTLLPKLNKLAGAEGSIKRLIRTTFDDANNYMKSGALLRQVIDKINGIDFNASDDCHMVGDIYETLLKDLQSAGNAGEFYTPRAVTEFIVQQVDPQIGERVLDPACGTGGFLVSAIEHQRKQGKSTANERAIQKQFAGIEKKHLPHVLCMTNLLLHGIDVPFNVRHENTLAKPLSNWGTEEKANVIVTNPPFGAMEEDGIEDNYPVEFRTRETADLFLLLIMHLLRVNGRAGLVLPDSTLSGKGVKTRIKEALLRDCNLHTIVRLPKGVFAPYTPITTNLLFFTKGQPTQEVWYYEHQYPAGVRSYNKTKPINLAEFQAERDWWADELDGFANRVETEHAWRVPVETIKANDYNLDLKNPNATTDVPGDVDRLLPDYEKLLAEIAQTLSALKGELRDALTSHRPPAERRK